MYLTTAAIALGLSSLTAASPASAAFNSQKFIPYVAKFDDVSAGLIANLPVRGITPLGVYNGLYYDHLGVIADNVIAAGVKPQSASNVIGYDAVSSSLGTPSISTKYANSNADHFSFKRFYFGCGLDTQESTTSPPVSCTINITGFRNGKQVASHQAEFVAESLIESMTEVDLPLSFSDVDKVTFVTASSLTSSLTVPIFDNVAYDLYLKQGKNLVS